MNNSCSNGGPIPVGFRFHPTDEELVGYYLHGKVGRAERDQLIQELDLYKLEPWDLHEVCRIGDDAPENQSDWYFFSHKDKKYPTGNRANRATAEGFWKATGRDKPIHSQRSSSHHNIIGMRKTLVFYRGRAPHGLKTDWIMHEFRLDEGPGVVPNYESDGWVVCRVFKKAKSFKTKSSQDTTTSCSFKLELDHPESQLILTENYMNSAVKRLLMTDNVAWRARSGEEDVQYPNSHLDHNFNFTCKQEISVDDYGNSIPDSPFTVDSGSSTLHHLHDRLHQTILQGAAGDPTLIVPRSMTSGPSLIGRCMQEVAYRTTKQQQLADHDQYSLAPALLNHNDSSSLRVDLDDARSSVTQELGGSCSASALPVLNNTVIEESWMLEPGAGPDNVIQSRLQRASGNLEVQRRDQTLGDVTSCHIYTKRQRTTTTEELYATSDFGNLVHLWNIT